MPGKLKEMQALFDQEAKTYNVLPLNNDTFARALGPRPECDGRQDGIQLFRCKPRRQLQ